MIGSSDASGRSDYRACLIFDRIVPLGCRRPLRLLPLRWGRAPAQSKVPQTQPDHAVICCRQRRGIMTIASADCLHSKPCIWHLKSYPAPLFYCTVQRDSKAIVQPWYHTPEIQRLKSTSLRARFANTTGIANQQRRWPSPAEQVELEMDIPIYVVLTPVDLAGLTVDCLYWVDRYSTQRYIPFQPRSFAMCYLEETYHAPCGHWGRRRNASPCPLVTHHKNISDGCWNSQVDGVRRVPEHCSLCLHQQNKRQGEEWTQLRKHGH